MKKVEIVILLFMGCIFAVSCGNKEIQKSVADNDNTKYSGVWTNDGYSLDYVTSIEGAYLSVNVEGTHLSAHYSNEQGYYKRVADVENIECEIIDGQASYDFTDDGWGSSGTLHITFGTDSVYVEVVNLKMSDNNLFGMSIEDAQLLREGTNSDPE